MANQGSAPTGERQRDDYSLFLVIAMMWIPAGLLIDGLRASALMGFVFLIVYVVKRVRSRRKVEEADKEEGDPGNKPKSPSSVPSE